MTTETMTIHKALAELKLLDNRITKTINEGCFCIANKHSNKKINGVSLDDFKKTIQGSYDKAVDLINRRKAIKKAVTLSNAEVTVSICGKAYTVAEAIEMKNHGIDFEKCLMDAMQKQYNKAQAAIKKENGKDLEARADQYVTAIYGQKEGRTNTDDIEKVRKDFIDSNSYDLVDPIDILDKINVLEKEIYDFYSEVDAALSVSNATHEITISY